MNVSEDWLVSLSVAEADGQARAEARLVMPGGDQLAGQLLHAAGTAIEDSTHEQAHLHL